MAEGLEEVTEELICPNKKIKLEAESKAEVSGRHINGSSEGTVNKNPKLVEAPPLPEGWVVVRNSCGINLYVHLSTRTCTISRPYTIPHSITINTHRIPVDAIPCLKKWLFREDKSSLAEEWHKAAGNRLGSLARLDQHRVMEYIKLRWPEGMAQLNNQGEEEISKEGKEQRRRKTAKKIKPVSSNKPAATVPENISKTVEIKVPKRYRIANVHGKISPSPWKVNTLLGAVSLLYEFCNHYLRAEVDFVNQETEDSTAPYLCTVVIGGTQYGRGRGSSKKMAKRVAADATLQLFLPNLHTDLDSISKQHLDEKYQFLSALSITDPSSADILNQAGLPSPWQMLRECIQRNKASGRVGEPEFSIELKPMEPCQKDMRQSTLNPVQSVSDPLQSTSDPFLSNIDLLTEPISPEPILDSLTEPGLNPLEESVPDPLQEPVPDPPCISSSTVIPSTINNGGCSLNVSDNTQLPAPPKGNELLKVSKFQSFYKLRCGEQLLVTGPCSGKKAGQQLAAQAMLKLMHPYIDNWDMLIKLYQDSKGSSGSARLIAEKEPTGLSNLSQNENSALLEELRKEMRKLSSN